MASADSMPSNGIRMACTRSGWIELIKAFKWPAAAGMVNGARYRLIEVRRFTNDELQINPFLAEAPFPGEELLLN